MALSFPSDRLDRGARSSAGPDPNPSSAGAPVESPEEAVPVPQIPAASSGPPRCDSCVAGFCCNGRHPWCECVCSWVEVSEVDAEFGEHPNDVTLAALADEGATEILQAVHDEVYGVPGVGWSV